MLWIAKVKIMPNAVMGDWVEQINKIGVPYLMEPEGRRQPLKRSGGSAALSRLLKDQTLYP